MHEYASRHERGCRTTRRFMADTSPGKTRTISSCLTRSPDNRLEKLQAIHSSTENGISRQSMWYIHMQITNFETSHLHLSRLHRGRALVVVLLFLGVRGVVLVEAFLDHRGCFHHHLDRVNGLHARSTGRTGKQVVRIPTTSSKTLLSHCSKKNYNGYCCCCCCCLVRFVGRLHVLPSLLQFAS